MGKPVLPDGDLTETAQVWLLGLSSCTPEQIATGVNHLVENGDEWPPSLPEFRAMCLPPKDDRNTLTRRVEQAEAERRRALPPPAAITAPGNARAHMQAIKPKLKPRPDRMLTLPECSIQRRHVLQLAGIAP